MNIRAEKPDDGTAIGEVVAAASEGPREALLGETIVFVLGDPAYYKRFAFSHESASPFDCVYQNQHLQALRLSPDAPDAGEVVYSAPLAALD